MGFQGIHSSDALYCLWQFAILPLVWQREAE